MPTIIDCFAGPYEFLSNFYISPVWGYPSVEHAFQAAKTAPENRVPFRDPNMTPRQAKNAGRKLELRPDWEEIKVEVMRLCLARKFAPGTELSSKLVMTEDAMLVEGNNWHDNIWGQCSCPDCKWIEGANLLGTLLMEIRDTLQEEP